MQIITLTTVGYGEGFPASVPGRTIGIFTCLSGQFLISILVGMLYSWVTFKPQEASAYQILMRKTHKLDRQQSARDVIIQAFRLRKYVKEQFKNKYAFEY